MDVDKLVEFYGCHSQNGQPLPTVYEVLNALQKDGMASLERAVFQIVSGLTSVTFTAINEVAQIIEVTIVIATNVDQDTVLADLRTYLAHLLNVSTDQVNMKVLSSTATSMKRDTTVKLAITIAGESSVIASAPALTIVNQLHLLLLPFICSVVNFCFM